MDSEEDINLFNNASFCSVQPLHDCEMQTRLLYICMCIRSEGKPLALHSTHMPICVAPCLHPTRFFFNTELAETAIGSLKRAFEARGSNTLLQMDPP